MSARRLVQAPLTWLAAILVVTDIRAWMGRTELGWAAGIATTLIVAAIALLAWAGSKEAHAVLIAAIAVMAMATAACLVIGWLLGMPHPGPRIAGAMIALAVPLVAWWVLPILAIGLVMSQSYLAIVAAGLGFAVTHRSDRRLWPIAIASAVILGAVVLIRQDVPLVTSRLDTWTRYAWPAFLERPLNGWGPGAWAPLVEMRQLAANSDFLSGHAHSDVVEWAVEYGLIGLVLLGGFVMAAWSRFQRSVVRGALVASGILSLGLHIWHIPLLMPWLAMIVGIGLVEESARG